MVVFIGKLNLRSLSFNAKYAFIDPHESAPHNTIHKRFSTQRLL